MASGYCVGAMGSCLEMKMYYFNMAVSNYIITII